MTPIDRILEAAGHLGLKQCGSGWTCRCPVHDDHNPSLSISIGDDRRVLVHCHAGCPAEAVCAALGLQLGDLFETDSRGVNDPALRLQQRGDGDETTSVEAGNAGCVAVANRTTNPRVFPTARDAVAGLERRYGARSATWTYTNAAGEPVGLVVRWDTPTGKDVRPVSRKADGSAWIIGGMPAPRPLYALPDLLATNLGARVYVTEGEKAADAARAVGLVATTSPHGSKSAGKVDWSPLSGRDVVILPDHDDAGERYADDVARLATAASARSVRIVRLIELWEAMPEGGDMADLAEYRGGDTDAIRAEVEALANKTEPEAVTPSAAPAPAFAPFPVDVLPEPIRSFVAGAAKSIGCDPSFVALPLLSALASAIGNTYRIELKRGWTEPAALWTAIVGESGTHKTPAFAAALGPLRRIQQEALPLLQRSAIVAKRVELGDTIALELVADRAVVVHEEAVNLEGCRERSEIAKGYAVVGRPTSPGFRFGRSRLQLLSGRRRG